MGRAPCCEDKEGLKKGAWTAEEDEKVVSFIQRNKGHGSWRTLPKLAGLERCGKSCRLRWTNYLRPNIKRGNFSAEEERIIFQLHASMGNKWSSIASHLPGRTDNEVKNHWNTHLKKRLAKMGIDPTTHLLLQYIMPHNQDAAQYYSLLSNHYQSNYYNIDEWKRALLQRSLQLHPAIACHLVQWELAKLEAEARMQIAAAPASSHDLMQSFASWMQSLQQNQAPSHNLNDYMHAINPQLQATLTPSNSCLVNPFESFQPSQYCEAIDDDQFLKQLNPLENEENHCIASSIIYNQDSSSRSVPHGSEGPVESGSNCSMGTPETCGNESTLVCDELELPDLLSCSSDEMMPALDPPSLAHDTNLLHDSYWNKMLNLVGPVTFSLDNNQEKS